MNMFKLLVVDIIALCIHSFDHAVRSRGRGIAGQENNGPKRRHDSIQQIPPILYATRDTINTIPVHGWATSFPRCLVSKNGGHSREVYLPPSTRKGIDRMQQPLASSSRLAQSAFIKKELSVGEAQLYKECPTVMTDGDR